MSFRVTPELKGRLDAVALQSGRSVAQEVEQRLESTLRDAAVLDQAMILAYGPPLAVALAVVAGAVLDISRSAPFPQTWIDRPHLVDEAAWAASMIFAAFRLGDDPPRDQMRIMVAPNIVARRLAAVKDPDQGPPDLMQWATPLHEKLGPELAGRLRVGSWVEAWLNPETGAPSVRFHPADPQEA